MIYDYGISHHGSHATVTRAPCLQVSIPANQRRISATALHRIASSCVPSARSQIEPKFRKKAIRIRSNSLNSNSNSMNRKEAVLLVHASSRHQLELGRMMFGRAHLSQPRRCRENKAGSPNALADTQQTELYSTLLASGCDPSIDYKTDTHTITRNIIIHI